VILGFVGPHMLLRIKVSTPRRMIGKSSYGIFCNG
jgi:hypothetical protein